MFDVFSKRNGYIKVDNKLQIESMNDDLRNSLWSEIYIFVFQDLNNYKIFYSDFCKVAYQLWFKKPVDTVYDIHFQYSFFKDLFFKEKWTFVYDFIDFILYYIKNNLVPFPNQFIASVNSVLEREHSGYRIIDDKIVAITDTTEKQTIEEAINDNSFDTAKLHLKDALDKLSDRQNPDYRNSIKESISAVEVVVRNITKASTLGDALPKLKDKGIEIPKILNSAMDKLYGYTNGTDGLRHGMMDIPNVNFEEAKYMLVVCSAFINYINCKLSKPK